MHNSLLGVKYNPARNNHLVDRHSSHDIAVGLPPLAEYDNSLIGQFSRDIPNGNRLFGDGHLEDKFQEFPEQHQCNYFCRWFRVPAFSTREEE
jgi:hypothetical protein